MNKKIKILFFMFVFCFITYIIYNYSIENLQKNTNKILTLRENSIYDDIINDYLAGKDVGAVDLGDGTVKIHLENGDDIIIPIKDNLDQLKRYKDNVMSN